MSFKKLSWRVSRKEFFKAYLKVMNGVLDLSPTELRIVSEFMLIREGLLSQAVNEAHAEELEEEVMSSDNKNEVCKELRITIGNLHNYVKKLKEKKMLVENKNGKMIINPTVSNLPPVNKLSTYDVIFRIEVEDGSNDPK